MKGLRQFCERRKQAGLVFTLIRSSVPFRPTDSTRPVNFSVQKEITSGG